ncbi:MAG: DUF502 domain-containing protein [Candidatus Omnitrophica bacterium]|nr:DUF502 domain-containing protein [Candidatus Omnitrophota bacterium]MBU1924463.1 DUF502 domain-containing protein [Candidatus Omnitrophota bacterium]
MKNMKSHLRRYFITGIVVLLPVFITINVLVAVVRFLDNLLGRYLNPYFVKIFGNPFFGVGILASLILIIITGILTTNVFIKKIMPYFERLFLRIPLVCQIYPSVKQLVKFLFSENRIAFKKVVLFEYPRRNVYTLGFVTNEFDICLDKNEKTRGVCIYISSAPNPITGFFVIVPKAEVTFLDMSIEEAVKIIISGGVLMSEELINKKIKENGDNLIR